MRYLLLLSCVIVILLPSAPSAQFGAIRKKIGEAAKKAGEPTDSTPKPAEQPAPPQPAASTAAPNNNSALIPITDTSLTALEKGLQTEITLRAAYKKELEDQAARAKQYDACVTQANTSPEMMTAVQKFATAFDNVKTRDDMMKVNQQMAAERDAVVAKKCGQAVTAPQASEDRLNDILRKAAAAAGPIQ